MLGYHLPVTQQLFILRKGRNHHREAERTKRSEKTTKGRPGSEEEEGKVLLVLKDIHCSLLRTLGKSVRRKESVRRQRETAVYLY